jgi:hypothetical protein
MIIFYRCGGCGLCMVVVSQELHRLLHKERAIGVCYGATFHLRPGDGQGDLPGGQGLPSYVSRQPYFQHMPRFLMHEGAQDGLTRRLAGTHLHLALENSGRGNRM